MATPAILPIGLRVSLPSGTGTIKFVGQTSFAAGKWVGVELDQGGGKNDGSVAGKRYFSCEEGYGVFVRSGMIKVLESDSASPTPPPTRPPSTGIGSKVTTTSTTRPLSASQSRPPSVSSTATATGRRMSTVPASTLPRSTSSASVSASTSRSASPTKLALKSPSTSAVPKSASRTISASPVLSPPLRPPSTSMPPPPSTRPLSPRKPSSSPTIPTPPSTNFAPSPGISKVSLSSASASASRRSSVLSNSSRVISPPLPGSSTRMTRTLSGLSGTSTNRGGGRESRAESLLSEEGPPEMASEVGLGIESAFQEMGASGDGEGDGVRRESGGEAGGEMSKDKEKDHMSLMEQRSTVADSVPLKTHSDLLTRYRILESRRTEDRTRIRDLERQLEGVEGWEEVRDRLKNRLAEVAAEGREGKKLNKDLQHQLSESESKLQDLQDTVELSLLDKEVAEERLEVVMKELEGVKERCGELEVEVEVGREELERMNGLGEKYVREGGGPSGESGGGISELAYRQLEKQNERLKDALVRLRDLTSEQESEMKTRIEELEKELDLTSDLQIDFENNLVELDRAENQLEDLKQQLDDAMGAEDLLEQLTEKNLTMSERIEEMKGIIEDLEAIQELNDELEENHVETEKQMQEEIDLKDLYLREMRTRAEGLEENVMDYESTIGQFRELVGSLQGDLEQLRLHQASQESESQSLTSQSQAMLNLNMKLQASVVKSQVKTIDLELRKLEAKQAGERLGIVKPYLLPAFFEEDSDAVDALLFFGRLAYKADLISMVMEQTHSVTDSLNSVVPEALMGICETRAKLAKYSALNKRFSAQLKRSTPDLFLKMGHVYREVAGTEKRIDGFIEALRREELREIDCGREIDGLANQIEHLSQIHLQETPQLDLAERELAYIVALDLDFDTIAAAAGFTKQSLVTLSKDSDVTLVDEDVSLEDSLFTPLQALVTQARNTKVATKKLLRRLEDLGSNSSALSMEYIQAFETLAYNSSAIAMAVSKLAADVSMHCSEVRTAKSPFNLSAVLALAQAVAHSELGKAASTPRPLEEIGLELSDLSKNVGTTLAAALDEEHVVQLNYEAPWTTRVAELQSTAATNVDAERKVLKLNEEMKDLLREMRVKDQSYQESAVKIELMEKRMESVKKQAEAITELEGELAKSKKQERAYEEAMEALQGDLDTMEQEISKLKANAPAHDKQGSTATAGEGEVVSYEGNMETSRLVEQIDSLRGAVRFLRSENSYLKSQDLLAELEHLPAYSPPPPAQPTPLLDVNAFASQRKQLLREARLLTSSPRLVDLSLVKPGGKLAGWQPSARAPEAQYKAEKTRARELGKKVERLWSTRPLLLV